MERKVDIIENLEGNKIVMIHDIRFRGKRQINWDDVEQYLKEYVGNCYEIIESADKVYIGSDFPSEFSGSNDTARLKGTLAKAKANATQGIPEMIQIAENERYQNNMKEKHKKDVKQGWYRYTVNFALPVYDRDGILQNVNVFRIELLIRCANDGKLYLYDMVNIKKRKNGAPRIGQAVR